MLLRPCVHLGMRARAVLAVVAASVVHRVKVEVRAAVVVAVAALVVHRVKVAARVAVRVAVAALVVHQVKVVDQVVVVVVAAVVSVVLLAKAVDQVAVVVAVSGRHWKRTRANGPLHHLMLKPAVKRLRRKKNLLIRQLQRMVMLQRKAMLQMHLQRDPKLQQKKLRKNSRQRKVRIPDSALNADELRCGTRWMADHSAGPSHFQSSRLR